MRRVAAALLAAGLLLGVAGCSSEGEGSAPEPASHYTFWQRLPGGGRVLCVWAKTFNAGGPSCDWEHVEGAR